MQSNEYLEPGQDYPEGFAHYNMGPWPVAKPAYPIAGWDRPSLYTPVEFFVPLDLYPKAARVYRSMAQPTVKIGAQFGPEYMMRTPYAQGPGYNPLVPGSNAK